MRWITPLTLLTSVATRQSLNALSIVLAAPEVVRYLSGAPVDEARLHSLLVPKIFLLFYFHPTAGMKYYWSRQSCLLSSTISGRQMVFDVMNLLYPSNTHHLPVVRSCVSTVASERGSSGPIASVMSFISRPRFMQRLKSFLKRVEILTV